MSVQTPLHPQLTEIQNVVGNHAQQLRELTEEIQHRICEQLGLTIDQVARLDQTKFRNTHSGPDFHIAADGSDSIHLSVLHAYNLNFVANNEAMNNTRLLDRVGCDIYFVPKGAKPGEYYLRIVALNGLLKDDTSNQFRLAMSIRETPGAFMQLKHMPQIDLQALENSLSMARAVFQATLTTLFQEAVNADPSQ